MEPTGNGIGGDWRSPSSGTRRRRSSTASTPAAARRNPVKPQKLRAELKKLNSTTIRPTGPLPVSVPGAVDGWFELHGKIWQAADEGMCWRRRSPTRAMASRSPRSSPRAGRAMRQNLQKFPGFSETYMPERTRARRRARCSVIPISPTPSPPSPKAAGTRSTEGDIAKRIDAYMRANGGYLTAADLAAHRSEWVDPVSTNYRGYDVWELPPNTQGVAALQMLNILEAYDLKSMGFGSAEYLHVFVEAKKLAFEDRAKYYADPEFAKIPLKGLLSKDYAAKQRALIKLDRAGLECPATPKPVDAGRHYLHDRRGFGGQHGLADPEQLSRHGLGHDAHGLRVHPAGSRRVVLASGRTRQRLCAGQAAVPHHHSRRSSPGTASRGSRSA